MMPITVSDIVTIAIVAGGLVTQAAYIKGTLTERISNNTTRIKDLEDGVRYKDTCDTTHAESNRRLRALERRTGLNGT